MDLSAFDIIRIQEPNLSVVPSESSELCRRFPGFPDLVKQIIFQYPFALTMYELNMDKRQN